MTCSPRQRQVDRAHRDSFRQGALRVVPTSSPRRRSRRFARSSRRRARPNRARRSASSATSTRASWTEQRIEQLGARPLRPLLDEVDAIGSVRAFLATAGPVRAPRHERVLPGLHRQRSGRPERYLVFLEQAGLGLPDESYYREEKFAEVREKYQVYLAKILDLAGLDLPRRGRSGSLRSRPTSPRTTGTTCGRATARRPTTSGRGASSSRTPRNTASTSRPGSTGSTRPPTRSPRWWFASRVFSSRCRHWSPDLRLSAWKDWLVWQVVRSNAAYLSSEFVNTNFDFYGKTLTGTPELRARWKTGSLVRRGFAR